MKKMLSILTSALIIIPVCSITVVAGIRADSRENASNLGDLFAEAINCGEPYKEVKAYIPYMGMLMGHMYDAKSREEYREVSSVFMNSFKSTLTEKPTVNCRAVFQDFDEIKRATHQFRDSLPPSLLQKLNLQPLPAVR